MGKLKLTVFLTIIVLVLAACSNSSNGNGKTETSGQENSSNKASTVDIKDSHGTVKVPVNPKNVIVLDSRAFETLADWKIKLVAAPKDVMPADSTYVKDASVKNIGNHREPNLEVIAAANPEVVIIGQRFANHYEAIKKLVPNAAVIDLNFDVSEKAEKPGENLINGFKNATITLGQIFDKNEEAKKLVADFDKSIKDAKAAYNGTDTVMAVEVSGGNIGFVAPNFGRAWGPMYEIFGWKPALEIKNATSGHKGDEISVEAIAKSNPDWILVLDRDAAVSSTTDAVPAKDVINKSPALQKVTAVSKGQIVYAPNDTYTNESIQTFIEIFNNLAKTLAK
ncbi:ABC transporter substrate-binding protein [Paenibacillus sp. N1-5-1-14]|uniref:siderophore ABC transporter substrate-binding protein n=1 Tax=Paenibacillus radicibacter TaxID=2972488 RepID=UPI002159274F|nr:ABC transporter substrate-binding protein [Paenibacillus radicibacter]MCR8644561.1 ABC transporter substrate-binding protein [Paenibacillus radicibacter]